MNDTIAQNDYFAIQALSGRHKEILLPEDPAHVLILLKVGQDFFTPRQIKSAAGTLEVKVRFNHTGEWAISKDLLVKIRRLSDSATTSSHTAAVRHERKTLDNTMETSKSVQATPQYIALTAGSTRATQYSLPIAKSNYDTTTGVIKWYLVGGKAPGLKTGIDQNTGISIQYYGELTGPCELQIKLVSQQLGRRDPHGSLKSKAASLFQKKQVLELKGEQTVKFEILTAQSGAPAIAANPQGSP